MRRAVAVLLLLLVLLTAWLLLPVTPRGLAADPRPVSSYAEAMRRIAALAAADSPGIDPVCGTRLMTHGRRTARAIVMLHGLTNCPAQFDSLARMSFARGANVLIPRIPRHGFRDRMTDELARLDAREMRVFTDRVLDAAGGLGEHVTVVGLSIGGTLAAWAAQERSDVDRAVLIAPMIGAAFAPGAWTPVVARLGGALPNLFVWWDDSLKQDLEGPRHVYPRFSTRAVAATLRIGWSVRDAALRRPPACRSVMMITVGGDRAVDNRMLAGIVSAWRRSGDRTIETYEFPEALKLNHDVVDPEQVGGNVALTYPVLTKAIGP